jgi:fatty acid omega-hydroxylase
VIKSKRRTSVEGAGLGPDLLSRFFEKSYLHDAEEPSTKELRDIVLNFIVAGRDTTACALSWTFYELTRHPEVVSKIIVEVNEICGVAPKVDYSLEKLNKLEYTHAVAMEAIRLHPSVPNDMKYAVHDDILPDGTFVPARAAVVYSPYALGRSKQIWGNDADMFNPERFFKQSEPSTYKFIAFNAGPRICLGKPLALMNMKMVLAVLLPNFNFQDFKGHTGEYDLSAVLRMKNGFSVRVSRREQKMPKM